VRFTRATSTDAAAVAELRARAADRLTEEFGHGHWSSHATERSVLRDLAASRVIVAREDEAIVGTLTLQSKKPWAIDVTHFSACRRALYLTNMAVEPRRQRQEIGRRLLAAALVEARAYPADAIRLDAYDAPAGAGDFYRACGYAARGRTVYRGVPLLYFELMTGVTV
jgi:ribosomal protein S18 acetylase RimI-like enzyme